jgi:hypothetical protein
VQAETVQCGNWQDFKKKILSRLYAQEPFCRGAFLFRGQRDHTWTLKSSYDRWFELTRLSESYRVPLAEQLLDRFKNDMEGISTFAPLQDRMQVLALAQHHGLPTRLLDWSESPYIAAFFAFAESLERASANSNVAIWGLDTRSYVWKGRGVNLLTVPNDRNLRLRNQDGRFTLLESSATSLEDHIASLAGEEPWPLYRFSIPATEARNALNELDIMGINASRIYPDLQGCSLNAKLGLLMRGDLTLRSS